MADKYQWAIEDIYEDEKSWEKDLKDVASVDFSIYQGKLNNKNTFLECMKAQEEVNKKFEKVYVYAMMLRDSDTRNSNYDALISKAMGVGVSLNEKTSYIIPELTSLSSEKLNSYIVDKDLVNYDYMLKSVLKDKKHILSHNEEKLLASSGETLSSFKDIFTKVDNADLPLKTITYNGKKIELSHGTYSVMMQNPDRNLRKKCFKEYYSAYISLQNVICATYAGSVKKDVFFAKARKYKSSLEYALNSEDVKSVVYKNLISSVHKALPTLHKYILEKKRALKLNKMHMYDMYVPTVENADLKLEYDEAYKTVIKGLAPLGKEYIKLLEKAYEERWLSVYETKGKRSGAYSVSVYGVHPYVLLNYQKTTHDVFTIAHEMGHSLHSYFSNLNQPYSKADYRIFVAEVASTVNEVLLIRYFLDTVSDKKLKKYLLSYLLEMIRTTLFRQTQFAEFEEFSHSQVEKGEAITKDALCEKYLELNKKYYGKSVISDEEIKYEWARIPHFYSAFYVYKYATGIISALTIADRILTKGKTAVDDYFKFLSSGGSDNPVDLLKIAGVDLEKKEPFIKAFDTFRKALEEFKSL